MGVGGWSATAASTAPPRGGEGFERCGGGAAGAHSRNRVTSRASDCGPWALVRLGGGIRAPALRTARGSRARVSEAGVRRAGSWLEVAPLGKPRAARFVQELSAIHEFGWRPHAPARNASAARHSHSLTANVGGGVAECSLRELWTPACIRPRPARRKTKQLGRTRRRYTAARTFYRSSGGSAARREGRAAHPRSAPPRRREGLHQGARYARPRGAPPGVGATPPPEPALAAPAAAAPRRRICRTTRVARAKTGRKLVG